MGDVIDIGAGKRRGRPRRRGVRPRWRPFLSRWLAAIVVVGGFAALILTGPFPPLVMLRHVAAPPNCDAVRAVGLAPALRGQPGYFGSHDRDNDGIACEPWPR